MMLDRDVILASEAHSRCGERLLCHASCLWRGERVRACGRCQREGCIALAAQVSDVRFLVVFHSHQ
jgi:hypothetical protein